MPRLLENWLYAFRDWTVPRSEAPESLIIWAGLFTIASVIKRRVSWPRSLMGSYDIFPNLYIVYVGPPGVIRKSTTSGYAEDLLGELEHITIASTATSTSKLVQTITETVDSSVSIISSELGSFVHVSEDDMYDFLVDVYDGKKKYEYATRTHGTEIAENPCINFLAATTPKWITENMPPYVIGGGFASRTIFIFEENVRQRQLYYELNWQDFERIREKLVHDLRHIQGREGQFKHDSHSTKAWAEQWYKETADEEVDESVEGYRNRRHVHLHKVAGLLSLAERDDLIVTRTHFETALAILSAIEIKLPRVFSAVGRNPLSGDIEVVRQYILDKGPVTFERLIARFYNNLSAEQLREITSALFSMGDIEKEVNEGTTLYKTKLKAV